MFGAIPLIFSRDVDDICAYTLWIIASLLLVLFNSLNQIICLIVVVPANAIQIDKTIIILD
jgi:hypothetical protein